MMSLEGSVAEVKVIFLGMQLAKDMDYTHVLMKRLFGGSASSSKAG